MTNRRLLVPLLAIGVALSSLSACEVIGADVAATVEGHDITVDQVQQLAGSIRTAENTSIEQSNTTAQKPEALKPPATVNGVLEGDPARAALSIWVQVELAAHELSTHHGSVTSADRQQATQQITSFPGLPADTKAKLLTGIASNSALLRVLTSDDKSPEIRKLAQQVYDQVPAAQRKQICAQAIVGPPDGADAVQKLIDGGTALTDAAAFEASGFQAIGTGGKFCINPAQLPTEIQDLYGNAPVGVVEHGSFTSQASDGSSQSGVIYFKVTGTSTLKPTDSAIIQAVVQEVKSKSELVLAPLFAKDAVHVDARFGSRFSVLTGIIAPTSPLVPPTKAKSKAGAKVTVPTAASFGSSSSNG